MTVEELIKILNMQEEILQFTHFTNGDAWELGKMIVMEAQRRGTPVSVIIQRAGGQTVFQYDFDQTTMYSEDLAQKKINTVLFTEEGSLRLHMEMRQNEESLQDMGLDPQKFAGIGGGFPIRIEEAGVIGAIGVAGGNHVTDHDLLIKCISKYLHIDEVPRIRAV